MPTAQSLIENACLALNVIDTGEGLSASELADALVRLNALIGNWNIQELMATSAVIDTVAISADAETATLAAKAKANKPLRTVCQRRISDLPWATRVTLKHIWFRSRRRPGP